MFRRFYDSAKRYKRLFCRVRGLFFNQLYLDGRLLRVNGVLAIYFVIALRINGKCDSFNLYGFFLALGLIVLVCLFIFLSRQDNGFGETLRDEQ